MDLYLISFNGYIEGKSFILNHLALTFALALYLLLCLSYAWHNLCNVYLVQDKQKDKRERQNVMELGTKVEVIPGKYHRDHCGIWFFAGTSKDDILLHANQEAAKQGEHTLAMHYSRVNWLVK